MFLSVYSVTVKCFHTKPFGMYGGVLHLPLFTQHHVQRGNSVDTHGCSLFIVLLENILVYICVFF